MNLTTWAADNLVFVDESGANLKMSTAYARAQGGNRVKMAEPFNRGTRISMIGAISLKKIEAALYGEWATNGDIFLEFIENNLLPQLRPDQFVIMDNVRFHHQQRVVSLIESKGARVVFLPPYSPEFSPIENMWSKIKTKLRQLAPRTVEKFQEAFQIAFQSIHQSDLMGWFKHCGYLV